MNFILWVDLETTGLNPREDFLLEVAAYLTDDTLEVVDSYEVVLNFNWTGLGIPALVGEKVFDIHTKNGLWEDCRRSLMSKRDAEKVILQMLKDAGCERGQALLGGSTINFDRAWLQEELPRLHDYLHYRNFDVSTLKRTVEFWRPDLLPLTPESNDTHRAGPDIRDSINYAKFYRDNVIEYWTGH